LLEGLSATPVEVLKNRQAYVVVLASEAEVRALSYRSEQLKKLAPFDVVVTAAAAEHDFSSVVFARCKFIDCTFNHCNLSLIKVPYSQFVEVTFVECKLAGVVSWKTRSPRPGFRVTRR
jgi:uncharacterized protein YjbI with pentapeptide repeats